MITLMSDDKPFVLAVDDNPQLLAFIKRSLELEGFRVITAECGEDALEMLKKEKPDIILLDIALPGIDGHETARRIRESSRVPIIMISARQSAEEKAKAFVAGADGYVTKPVGAKELTARVRSVLRRTGSSK
jgi:two-component system KDP operon response regulator KdpE